MPVTDLFPRPAPIPLPARVAIARGAALVLAAIALVAGAFTSDRDASDTVPPALIAVVVLLTIAVSAYVAHGGWAHRRDDRGVERLLLTLNGIPAIGLLASYVTDTPDDIDALLLLAPVLVIAVLTLPPRRFAIGATAVVGGTMLSAGLRGTLGEVSFVFLMLVAVTVLGGLAAAVLAEAFGAQQQREVEAATANRALRAVVDGARTATSDDPAAVLEAVVESTKGLDSDTAGIYLLHGDGRLRWAATWNVPDELADEVVPRSRGVASRALRENRVVVTNDYREDPDAIGSYQDLGLRAAVAAPIRVGGEAVGVLAVGRYRPGGYDTPALTAIELLADHAGHALALSRAIDEDRRTLHRLQSLHALQEDFVATVSHELRTPITVIDGLAETISVHADRLSPEQSAEMLARLRANATSLRTIVTSLLEAARLDRGLVELEEAVLDLAPLIETCVERLEPVLTNHDVRLDLTAVTVVGDADLLERVIDNLVTNAASHTPPGTVVRVEVRPDGCRCEVVVSDDGPGIPSEALGLVTQRFTRGGDHHTRATRGLGLGLALAEQVLRLHGSHLEVSSPPGEGARFRFTLPMA